MKLPDGFIESLQHGSGTSLFAGLPEALSCDPVVSVRLNPAKSPADGWAPPADPVGWAPRGRYLTQRPAFIFDPLMHQGAYYVQEASSMFIGHILRHLTAGSGIPLSYLDACAAPGGKTGAAIGSLPPGSVVWANEYVASRAAVLRENLAKTGYPLTITTVGDTSRFAAMKDAFDIVATDVPCSGEGMMRKEPEAVAQWSPELIRQCASLQRAIVANVWPSLKPGGYLIYSTCTFNRHENEENLRWIIDTFGAQPVVIPTDPAWKVAQALEPGMQACRFVPGLTRGEGLFMAVLRKPGSGAMTEAVATSVTKKDPCRRKQPKSPAAKIPPGVESWIDPALGATLQTDGEHVTAVFPQCVAGWHPQIEIATIKGHDAIPAQQLALSRILRRGAFPETDTDRLQALRYLRGEDPQIGQGAPKGHILLTHRGLPLGFVKNIGNRCNNLYPRPWRIVSTLPEPLPPLPAL